METARARHRARAGKRVSSEEDLDKTELSSPSKHDAERGASASEDLDATELWQAEEAGDATLPAGSDEQLDPTILAGERLDPTEVAATGGGGARTAAGDDAPTLVPGGGSSDDPDATAVNPDTAPEEDATVVSRPGATGGAGELRELPSGGMLGAEDGVVILSNRYQFHLTKDRLGGGGMGTVYRALDLQYQREVGRDRYFAVKVLNEKFAAHEAAVKSMVYETDRTRSLNHDHIARVFTFDRDGETIYMVMELLEGEDLEDFIERPEYADGMPKDEAFAIVRDIGEALAYAHAAGVVHSDFKPGNVFVTKGGGAKVIDFGIARAAANPDEARGPVEVKAGSSGQATYFDPSSLHALTPTYASLEMFTGELPDEADDVYALALVAYQLLTGKHPYQRKSALDVYQILQANPNSPEAKAVIPERPPGLTNREWRALRHGMEIERSRRTQTAREFLDELFGKRATSISWIAVGLAVVIAAGTIGYTQWMRPAPSEMQTVVVNVEANNEDLAAASELSSARERAMDLMNQDEMDEFWRRSAFQDLAAWRDVAGVTLDLGSFDDAGAAEDLRKAVYESTGYGTRVVDLPDGRFAVRAGPFVAARDEARKALESGLQAGGFQFTELRDDDSIADFEKKVVDRYVKAIDAKLAQAEKSQLRDAHNEALAAYAVANEWLDELSQRYSVDADVLGRLQRSLTNGRARSTATLGAQDRLVEDVRATWACNRISLGRISSGFSLLPQIIDAGRRATLMDGLFECLVGKTTEDGYDELRAAALRGNEQRFSRLPPPVLADTGPTKEEMIAEIQGLLISDDATQQDNGIELLVQRLVGGDLEESDLGGMFQAVAAHLQQRIDQGHVEEARDRLELLSSSVPTFPRSVSLRFPRPDPCAKPALIGSGRPCRDALDNDVRAPALVVVPGIDGGKPYAVTRDELTIAVYGPYCEATGRCKVSGDRGFPVTGISAADIEAYASWLTEHSGYTYRLPTVAEWRNAAEANGAPLDGNRNCSGTVLGISRGESLQSAEFGKANPWGLRNAFGNAQELAMEGDHWVALGGAHTDPLAECIPGARNPHDGSPDPITGFRLLRELR